MVAMKQQDCNYHYKALIIFTLLFISSIKSSMQFENCPEYDGCQKYITSTQTKEQSHYRHESRMHVEDVVEDEILKCRSYIDVDYSIEIKTLHLCKYDNTTFYLNNVVKKLPNVRTIEIIDSNVSYLIEPNVHNNITLLRINNSTLKRVADNLALAMRHLHVLDFRNNSLSRLPERFTHHHQHLKHIYLSNNKWNCTKENLEWTSNINISMVKDQDLVNCYGEPFKDKPIFRIAKFQENMSSKCPHYCECNLVNVVRDIEDSNMLNPIISVNCSNQNLLQLPESLPNLTKILYLENNFISDLSPIITNKAYKDLLELYLDNNQVSSIAILEGGQWLEKFSILSLRSNRLVQLPTYALDNALKRNGNMPNAVLFYLAGNPWRCDCAYTPHFQEMLMKYEQQIKDIENVRCRYAPGDENSQLPILSLSRSSICRQPSEYAIKPLDLVNIILASLIILVLGKLAYDYYFFKKTGRLPWIVSKMP